MKSLEINSILASLRSRRSSAASHYCLEVLLKRVKGSAGQKETVAPPAVISPHGGEPARLARWGAALGGVASRPYSPVDCPGCLRSRSVLTHKLQLRADCPPVFCLSFRLSVRAGPTFRVVVGWKRSQRPFVLSVSDSIGGPLP